MGCCRLFGLVQVLQAFPLDLETVFGLSSGGLGSLDRLLTDHFPNSRLMFCHHMLLIVLYLFYNLSLPLCHCQLMLPYLVFSSHPLTEHTTVSAMALPNPALIPLFCIICPLLSPLFKPLHILLLVGSNFFPLLLSGLFPPLLNFPLQLFSFSLPLSTSSAFVFLIHVLFWFDLLNEEGRLFLPFLLLLFSPLFESCSLFGLFVMAQSLFFQSGLPVFLFFRLAGDYFALVCLILSLQLFLEKLLLFESCFDVLLPVGVLVRMYPAATVLQLMLSNGAGVMDDEFSFLIHDFLQLLDYFFLPEFEILPLFFPPLMCHLSSLPNRKESLLTFLDINIAIQYHILHTELCWLMILRIDFPKSYDVGWLGQKI